MRRLYECLSIEEGRGLLVEANGAAENILVFARWAFTCDFGSPQQRGRF